MHRALNRAEDRARRRHERDTFARELNALVRRLRPTEDGQLPADAVSAAEQLRQHSTV